MNAPLNIELLEEAPLTLQTRAALALNSSKTERDLIALAAKNVHIVAVIDKDGRQQAHGAAMELKRTRTAIAGVSKEARDDATQFQKAIIAEEKRLIEIIQPEESRLLGLRDKWDDEQAMIRAAAEQAERERISVIQSGIAGLRNYLIMAGQCRTSDGIMVLINKLEAIRSAGYESFDEFAAEASATAATTFDAMVKLHDDRASDEIERANAKAEADALAKQVAEDKAAAAEEAAKLAAERAALDAERAAFKAQQAAIIMRDEQAAIIMRDEQAAIIMRDEQAAREVREAQERAAYAAAINAAPVVDATIEPVAPTVRQQFEKTFAAEAWSPSDVQILDALCIHFGKSERMVFERLSKGIDLAALELACFDEITA